MQNEYEEYVVYCKRSKIKFVSFADWKEELHEKIMQAYYGENDFR